VGAVAAVAYAVLVAVENLDVAGSPGYDSSVRAIAEAYRTPDTKLVITTAAGAAALVAYLVAALALRASVRRATVLGPPEAGRASSPWATAALVAACAGPVLGAVGLGLQTVLVLGVDHGLSDDAISRVHEVRLAVHSSGALPIGVFALSIAVLGARHRRLPTVVTTAGAAIGIGCMVASAAWLTRSGPARAVLLVLLGLAMAWLVLASLWRPLGAWSQARHDTPWMLAGRVLAGAVAVAAGVSGLALLAFPGATVDYFSWALAPAPLASLIGGWYLASALVYGWAAAAPWPSLRPLLVGVVALSLPVFAATLAHLEAFDFDRLQAWAWAVLFGVFPVAGAVVLARARSARPAPTGAGATDPLPWVARAGAGALAVGLTAISVALWVDPSAGAGVLPFTPPPLSGRVLGGWTFLVAVLGGLVAADADRARNRWAALALAAFPAGALAAALRSLDDLSPAGTRAAYLAGLVAWLAIGTVIAWAHGTAAAARAGAVTRSRAGARPG
jgi:hypothetical protein